VSYVIEALDSPKAKEWKVLTSGLTKVEADEELVKIAPEDIDVWRMRRRKVDDA